MSFKITINSGATVRLPTGGKFCGEDIIVEAKEPTSFNWEPYFWNGVEAGTGSDVTLPDGLTTIPSFAFQGKTDLERMIIPTGVSIIGEGAFAECSKLSSLTLPNGIENIEGDAFVRCTLLALTSLPDTVKKIGSSAFAYCGWLMLYKLPESLESIGSYTFVDCSHIDFLASRYIPENVKSIGNCAFINCTKLDTIRFKGTPESISASTFEGCENLTSIYVPWSEGEVANAPWGATNATVYYDQTT